MFLENISETNGKTVEILVELEGVGIREIGGEIFKTFLNYLSLKMSVTSLQYNTEWLRHENGPVFPALNDSKIVVLFKFFGMHNSP